MEMKNYQDSNKGSYAIALAIILAGALVAGAVLLNQGSQDQQLALTDIEPEQLDSQDLNIEIEGWPTLGDPDAPVTLVEYSDYACPFCTQFQETTLPRIKEEYIDQGLVYFVYKDHPTVGGNKAAEAAHCAGEQDAYWQYHDLLFENSNQDRGKWSDPAIHQDYAEELNLDSEKLTECFQSNKFADKVTRSSQEATSQNVTGVPHFFINNEQISGAQPWEVFEQYIESELEKADHI